MTEAGATVAPARRQAEGTVGDRGREPRRERSGLEGFLTTVDHKRIGRRYLVTAAVFFVLAGLQALVMRTQLATARSGLVEPEVYNQLFSLHGTVMIFFFITPMLFGLGSFLLPLMLGTRELAFPRLNAFGYWLFASAGALMFLSLVLGQAPDGGWTAYAPLTTYDHSPGSSMDFYTLGVLMLSTSTTAGAVNLVVTALRLRAPGMSLDRVPVFVWAVVVSSAVLVLAVPPLNAANLMLFLDRRAGTHFFDPGAGGDAVLWQHLFWLFGHPEMYVIVLPALGIVSSVVPVFSRRPLAAHSLVVAAVVATGVLSVGVWAHHMFAVGLPQLSLAFSSAATVLVAVPLAVQVASWLTTMLRGRVVPAVPLLWVVGSLVTFTTGVVTGVLLALVPLGQQTTDSYFEVAHLHYVLVGGGVLPVVAGLFYWWPKLTGRTTSARGGRWSFWLVLVGLNVTFFPMHVLGLLGMPRRVYTYLDGTGWGAANLVATLGSYVLALGLLVLLGTFLHSLLRGRQAPADPWGGATLEWATSSPPRPDDFAVLPSVHSLHPLWDAPGGRSLTDGTEREDPVPGAGHTVLRTSELDAEPEGRLRVAEGTVLPFVAATAVLAVVCLLLVGWYVVAAGAVLVLAGVVAAWLWPGGPRSEGRGRSTGEWGTLLLVVGQGVLFACLLAAYSYLGLLAGGPWPPAGVEAPALAVPLVMTALLLGGSAALAGSDAAQRRGRNGRQRLAVAVALVLGGAFLALQGVEYADSLTRLTWTSNAYGSLFYLLTGLHAVHVAAGLLMLGVALVAAPARRSAGRGPGRLTVVATYWHFLVVVRLVILFAVYLSPRL